MVHIQTIEDLVDSEREIRRKMIRMFNELKVELKEQIQTEINESKTWIKNSRKHRNK
jgi:hypothetical protein